MSTKPPHLTACDPRDRLFPKEWKESYFRRNISSNNNGYICPICQNIFIGVKGLNQLEADHKIPFSKGGLTTWENMELLCKKCNNSKSNNLV